MKINSKSIFEKVDYYIDTMLLNEQEDSDNNINKINESDGECCKGKEKDYDKEDGDEDEDEDKPGELQVLHDEDEPVGEMELPLAFFAKEFRAGIATKRALAAKKALAARTAPLRKNMEKISTITKDGWK